jgi:serine/threonine protein kinase
VVTTDQLAEGTQIGNYRIERLLGSSRMGHVYVAKHLQLDKSVALKVLARHLLSRPSIVQRFLREGRAAARVRHEHVIDIIEVGTAANLPYLAMALLEGESLARRFANGPMPAQELTAIMMPVLAAVQTAHDMGVIHRDLKPEDIFLSQDARGHLHPVVLNFGMSKLIGEASLPPMEARSGTHNVELPYYLAPEQARGGRNVRGATDQYALGVIMYQGATGHLPFEGSSLLEVVDGITSGKFVAPATAQPGLPDVLARVIVRAMSMQVTDRYTSLWAMGVSLLPVADARTQATWRDVFGRNTSGVMPSAPPRATDSTRMAAHVMTVVPNESSAAARAAGPKAPPAKAEPPSRPSAEKAGAPRVVGRTPAELEFQRKVTRLRGLAVGFGALAAVLLVALLATLFGHAGK